METKFITNKSTRTRVRNQVLAILKNKLSYFGTDYEVKVEPNKGMFEVITITEEEWHYFTSAVIETIRDAIRKYEERYAVFMTVSTRYYYSEEMKFDVPQPAIEIHIPMYED